MISHITSKLNIYKDDIISIIIILIITLFFLAVSWLKWGHPVMDCGREAYLPWQINNGKILYTDLYNYYGPFAYHLISIAYKIIGTTLNTIYITGIITSLSIYTVLYLLARKLLSPYVSAITVITYILIGSLTPNLGGYEGTIFPYSFASLFGLLFILLQIYFLLMYFSQNNNIYIYSSALFASLSICCKQDTALSSLLITLFVTFYIFLKYKQTVLIFLYWVLTLFLPCLCYGIFLFYLPADYFIFNYLLPTNYLNVEHNKEIVVPFFSFSSAFLSIKFFFISIITVLSTTLCINYCCHVFIWTYKKLKMFISKGIIYLVTGIFIIYLLFEFYFFLTINFLITEQLINHLFLISWFPMFISLIVLMYLYWSKFKGYILTHIDFVFLFLSLSGICVAIRGWSYCYSTYIILPLIIPVAYLFAEKLPEILTKLNIFNTQHLKTALFSTIALVLFAFGAKNYFIFINMKYPVSTERGTFLTFPQYAMGYNSAIDFIKNNLSDGDQFTCFPQETLLNFITAHPTPTIRLQYMMNEPIDLKKPLNLKNQQLLLKSKYIFISNFPYFLQKKYYFGVDYHQELFKFIQKHYTPVCIAGRYELKYKDDDHGYGFLIWKRND